MVSNQISLDLVPKQLKPLFPLEEELLKALPQGRLVSGFPKEPIDMAQIGEAQSVRSEFLVWVLTTTEVCKNIHHKGLQLKGAKILSLLDLEDSHIECPLRLINCIIEEKMILDRGKYKLLDFTGSHTESIQADSIQVQHDFLMCDGFKANGEVGLYDANIGGSLDCIAGEFENRGGVALNGDRLTTKGSIFISSGFKAKGEVRLPGANIGCDLDCREGEFQNPDGVALSCDGLTTKSDVYLMKGYKAQGAVRLLGANIGGNLECDGGDFENPDGVALFGDYLTTKGAVFLRNGFKARGEVRLLGTYIDGFLDCVGGEFENPHGDALSADRIITKGSIFLRDGFKANGDVRLIGANIGGDLECDGGEFNNPNGDAFSGDGLTTKGSVYLGNGFIAKGAVRLPGAHIGGDLNCSGGEFENTGGKALYGNLLKVEGSLVWRGLAKKPKGLINLDNTSLANLDDDENSWPEPGNLNIDGLVYGQMTSHVKADSKSRLRWLDLRNPDNLNVQPYEQLIRIFKQMGLREDARDVAIAKQKVIRKKLSGIPRLWSSILDVTISYGYQPEKVIVLFILPIIMLGSIVFAGAFRAGVMEPTANLEELSGKSLIFDPVGYSLDVFLPIVDLHQESAWEPNADIKYGIIFQYYMYFHILAGWFFTTLAVAAVTGLVRSD
jgi:hypothetical protein